MASVMVWVLRPVIGWARSCGPSPLPWLRSWFGRRRLLGGGCSRLLFPNKPATTAEGWARNYVPSRSRAGDHTRKKAIDELISWVNRYCHTQGLDTERVRPTGGGPGHPLAIPQDPVAWHIVRRARGLIAGAIQYGHLHVRITLGERGSYASGFPHDHAYEDWLFRLKALPTAKSASQLANT